MTTEQLAAQVDDKIAQYVTSGFPEARTLHETVLAANPSLCPRLWYGMPGYAKSKDSAVLCFFRKDTLISFGITESAALPAGPITPSAWYITEVTQEVIRHVSQIVRAATA